MKHFSHRWRLTTSLAMLFAGFVCGCSTVNVEEKARDFAMQMQRAMVSNHRDSIELISDDATDWLESLEGEEKAKAEEIIRSIGKQYTDSIMKTKTAPQR